MDVDSVMQSAVAVLDYAEQISFNFDARNVLIVFINRELN